MMGNKRLLAYTLRFKEVVTAGSAVCAAEETVLKLGYTV